MQPSAHPGPAVSIWFLAVACLFVTCLVISNIVAAKLALIVGLILPAAVILFPVSYILGDVLTEVYGYARARQVIWIGFGCNLLAETERFPPEPVLPQHLRGPLQPADA